MDYGSEDELKRDGFIGFHRVGDLMANFDSFNLPRDKKGIYFTLYRGKGCPKFIPPGPGVCYHGYGFKEYSEDDLRAWWVDDVIVINISQTTRSLYDRIKEYIRFGKGEVPNHRGGRAAWQISDYHDLAICWKGWSMEDSKNPKDVERSLIDEFEMKNDKKPFANRKRGG